MPPIHRNVLAQDQLGPIPSVGSQGEGVSKRPVCLRDMVRFVMNIGGLAQYLSKLERMGYLALPGSTLRCLGGI